MNKMNKTLLAALIASTFASSAYAAKSPLTEQLVGFKPVLNNLTTGVTGELALGKTLTADAAQMGFFDADGDDIDPNEVEYIWRVAGQEAHRGKGAAGASYTIHTDPAMAGKAISLTVIPATLTGDPKVGNEYPIANLLDAGATGGDGGGNLAPDLAVTPIVSDLTMAGTLQVGRDLTATYNFNANGGEPTDRSVHTWSGNNNGQLDTAIAASEGDVAAYTLKAADVGEIIELAVLAKNGAGEEGNTVTVNTAGTATDTGPGANPDGVGGGTSGGVVDDNNDDLVDYQPSVDPASVTITFTSSANESENGQDAVDKGRPVLNKDVMTANFDVVEHTSPLASDYLFKWYVEGDLTNPVAEGVGMATFNAVGAGLDKAHQGKGVLIEVTPK